MTELGDSLERMSFVQLLLLFGFVISYMLALGGMFSGAVRLRAAGLALVQALAFTVLTRPWVHGALLMAFVVAGLGLFVMFSWLLARLLGPKQLPPATEAPSELGADTTTLPSQPQRPGELLGTATKLVGRARATR